MARATLVGRPGSPGFGAGRLLWVAAVEPASAASVAGLLKAAEEGLVDPGQRSVCTVTGNGLKDPDWAVAGAPQPVTVPVDADVAAERLGLA